MGWKDRFPKDNRYWESENGILYCGDCLEIMKGFGEKSVDLVLTDPPYDKRTHKGGMFSKNIEFGNVDFGSIDIIPVCRVLLRIVSRWILLFTSVENLGLIREKYNQEYIRGGIWDRIVNSPQISGDRPAQAVEGIAILHNKGKKQWNGGGKAGIWRFSVERGNKIHPTQKPIKLINALLSDFSNNNDLILDPFFGSGTTGVACEKLGRRWIGIEISEKYCEIAKRRIKAEADQRKLFF